MLHGPIKLSILAFATALLASLGLTYLVRERARRLRLFDPTDERKLHTEPIPRVGGVAIFLSVATALVAIAALGAFDNVDVASWKLLVILAGGAATHMLGLYDDLRQVRARYKFAVQIAIAVAVFLAGVRIDTISIPLVGQISFGPVFALIFTTFWFVGITNAFNLIDGLDGLASGAALFALTTMFVVATINHQAGAALVTIAVAGATLGFLRYNFHPATIFLGDSGSLFLGFMLAGIGAISSQKGSTVVAIAIPLVSLGLPVLDTSLAIIRRFLRGQPIFSADRGHIHHRLLGLGLSPRQVALLMYGGCAVLALGGMLLVNDSGYVAVVLVLVGLGVGVVVQQLRYQEFHELARVLGRATQQRYVIGRNVRLREASRNVGAAQSLGALFEQLETIFVGEDFRRAEVRLTRGFLIGRELGGEARRRRDDISVWTMRGSAPAEPAWWEISLPLVQGDGERVGSLTLWHDGSARDTSLSYIATIARDLRAAVEDRILTLWPEEALALAELERQSREEFELAITAEAPIGRREPPRPAGRAARQGTAA